MRIKQIKQRGIPNLRNARFITLTVDPSRYPTPVEAYESGKSQLKHFFAEMRKALNTYFGYAWKLEFQDNGYPHWHIIALYRKKLPYKLVDKSWRRGRTNTERIKAETFEYLFKYVTKDQDLPAWVLDYPGEMRFWQTTNFYTKDRIKNKEQLKSGKRKKIKRTIREKQERWQRMALIKNTDSKTKRGKYSVAELYCTFGEMWNHFVNMYRKHGYNAIGVKWTLQFNNPIHVQSWLNQQQIPIML